MPTIKIAESEIFYNLQGQGDPLVLIAGYASDHTFWGFMAKELAEHFQVLSFDHPGVGQTKDLGSRLSIDSLAETTMGLIRALDLNNAHIMGQSMGGAIAQTIAKKYPQQINKLIILNSVAKFSARANLTIESLLDLRKQNISVDCLIEASLPWFFSNKSLASPAHVAAIKQLIKNTPYPQSLVDQERQSQAIPEFDSRSWLHEIKAPTLIIAMEEDILTTPSECQMLAEGITNAKFKILPGAHASALEQPREINQEVLKFL